MIMTEGPRMYHVSFRCLPWLGSSIFLKTWARTLANIDFIVANLTNAIGKSLT